MSPSPDEPRPSPADEPAAAPAVPLMSQQAPPTEHLDRAAAAAPSPPFIEGYRVIRQLSRGGQGIIYQAVQTSTQRRVAIKVLLESWADEPSARRRFEREIELVSHLRHPSIITVFDSGRTPDGRLFYVMDFVSGEPITRYARERRLAMPAILELFAAVCDAVSHAHQKGVIHRDLKPSNILVDAEQRAYVLDFGLAKGLGERPEPLATLSGEVLGTPAYMSPEQARGHPDAIDVRSDVYSLGVILYELLTGRFPYPVDGTILETARHIEHTSPSPPAKAWSSDAGAAPSSARSARCPLDPEIETIVLKTLAKERERRYQSAGELARDVRHYLSGEPIEARRDSALYVLRKTIGRYRAAAIAAALFILLLAASSIIFFAQRQDAREARRQALIDRDRARLASEESRKSQRLAEHRSAEALIAAGDSLLVPGRGFDARASYLQAWDTLGRLGETPFPAIAGLLATYQLDPPPLMGGEGYRTGVGGFLGHELSIGGVAILPDGRRGLSCGVDRTIRLWDLPTGREIRRFVGHTDTVRAIAVCPGGRQFISASLDHALRLWDIETGRDLKTFTGHTDAVSSVAVFPDGHTAASGSHDGTVRLWDVATAKEQAQFGSAGDKVTHVAISRDGALVLASCAGTQRVRIWDVKSRTELREQQGLDIAEFMPDSRFIFASVADWTSGLVLQDREEAKPVRRFAGHSGWVSSIRISPAGRVAFSSSTDQSVKVWLTETGQLLRTLGGHVSAVGDVDASADQPFALSGSADATLKLWDLRTPSPDIPAWQGHSQAAVALAFSPDGLLALSGATDGAVRLWDVETGQTLWVSPALTASVESVGFSPDGRLFGCSRSYGNIDVWDLPDLRQVASFRAEASAVSGVLFLPDGKSILATSDQGMPRTWDISTGRDIARLAGPAIKTTALALSPDGRFVAACAGENEVRLWSLPAGTPVHTFEARLHAGLRTLAFSPGSSRLLAGDWVGGLWLFDIPSRRSLGQITSPIVTAYGVGFLGKGEALVAAGADRTLRLWDTSTGRPIHTFAAHDQPLSAMAISPDGMRILTAGHDKLIRLWDFSRPQRYRDFERDLPAARAALGQNPSDPVAIAAFGHWYAFRRAYPWAADLLDQARAAGALDMARCHWQLGHIAAARAQFDRALAQKEAPEPYLRLCLRALPTTLPTTRRASP